MEAFAQKPASAFSQLLPVTELTNRENIQEALFILENAFRTFKNAGVKNSGIPKLLADAKKGGVELEARFRMAKQEDKSIVYSVKLEVNGQEKVVTLRLGLEFTELSLHEHGRLREIMIEKDGKVTHEKYA